MNFAPMKAPAESPASVAFLTKFFNEIGIIVDCYIPSRKETDYGVSKNSIDYFLKIF